MWKRITLCSFSILAVIFCYWQYIQMKPTSLHFFDKRGKEHVLILPSKDKSRLKYLMRNLFANGNFAYTILGNKPMSWDGYLKPFPFRNWSLFYRSLSKYNHKMREGWKTWLKYRHLFPSDPLLYEVRPDAPHYVSIFIVNKKRFKEVINENQKDFQAALGRENVDGAQLLQEAKEKSFSTVVLKHHQALIGILLGYGRDNSWKFHKAYEKRQKLGWVWADGSYPTTIDMTSHKEPTYTETYLSLYSCPSFAGDPYSQESLTLKKEYLLTRENVLAYYKGKDFLEATLTLLASFE